MNRMNKYKKNNIKYLFFLFLLLALTVTGCGRTFQTEEAMEITEETDRSDKTIVVGVSQVGSESVWRTANSNSIQRVFTQEKGYFLIFENARQKQENQIKAIRSFISQQVDYIVFSPITEDGWDTVLQEAKDAHIPVILMDRQINVEDSSLYTAWVGSDFFTEGKNAAYWLAEEEEKKNAEEEEVNIVVLQGTSGATSEIGRTHGFNSVAKQHDNWNILEQVDADYTTAKGKEEMERLLRKYPDIDVVVSQNDDMTFGALEAIWAAGKTTGINGEITVISFDAVKAALLKVKDGSINVDVECNPEQGPAVEQIIQDLQNGKRVEKENYIEEKIFTSQNVEQYLDERTY